MVPDEYLVSAKDKMLITILKNEIDKKAERLILAHELSCHRNHNKNELAH